MNRIKYENAKGEKAIAVVQQLRKKGTLIDRREFSMADADREMLNRGFFRSGNRWRKGTGPSGEQRAPGQYRALWVNFKSLYRRLTREKRAAT